jgi:hypothetical protein
MEKNNKIAIVVGVGIVSIGLGVGLWLISKKPKTETPTAQKLEGGKGLEMKGLPIDVPAKDNPISTFAGKNSLGGGTNSLGVDYSGLSVSLKSPANNRGLSLGLPVTVKAGTSVIRMDKYLNKMGATTINANTNFGTVFALNPSSVVIKQNKKFDYPFYQVAYESLYPQK